MRTSNILMTTSGQYNNNQPGYPSRSIGIDTKLQRPNENVLPPLEYKNRTLISNNPNGNPLSSPNPLANKRQLSPASVLPNLKSVIENLSNENLNTLKSNNAMGYNVPKNYLPPPNSIGNTPQYPSTAPIGNSRINNHPVTMNNPIYHPNPSHNGQFSLNAPIKFIINRGITIYQGDHVSIRGSDSHVYFAVLMDFWLTENGKRYCTLRWLLPKPNASFTSALHDRFDLGPVHERVEAMETILDVFYSPYRDQMTAENIRKKYLLSTVTSNDHETSLNVLASIDPPAQLIKAIKLLDQRSETGDLDQKEKSFSSSSAAASDPSSPSSHLFKTSDEVPLNLIVAESSEIAAKMLLSMN